MTTNSEATVTLTASDGHGFGAFVVRPEGQSAGGLVILQEIFGVTEQLKDVARSYAHQGYTAVVPALYDRFSTDTVIPFDQGPAGLKIASSLDPVNVLLDVQATAAFAGEAGGASVLGFCWGGGLALRAAIGLDIKGAVAFYGTRLESILGPDLKCPMQFHCGATDPHNSPEVIKAIRQMAPDAEIHMYTAGHAFANEARPAVYDKAAADIAHARTAAFLKSVHRV